MKVSTVKPEFQPVVITLETQEEVNQMFTIVCNNMVRSEGRLPKLAKEIYENIWQLATNCIRL